MLLCSNLPVLAAEVEEEYLADIRLVYADDYDEAREALVGSAFESYKVFNYNLNDDTGEVGVWLAYKTTTDINDAITDISIMQMDGGYKEGNYQAMIEESRTEYERMCDVYHEAIDYFIEAYNSGDFLADLAYRQLNFYTSITDESLGIVIPDIDGEPLGDVLYSGISTSALATIFMEGNSYALDNIRSLLAMGVSYNEDGMHYLEKVAEAAELFERNEDVFEDHDYYDDFDDLALIISGSIRAYNDMFRQLAVHEGEMNYYDDEATDLELEYIEEKSIADRFREVEYFNGETLYDFCIEYEYDEDDLTPLYPLVAALNVGQIAMTKVAHYYDVVRYSMSDYPEEELEAEVEELEEVYSRVPFNVYNGVDRSIYYGTFALTNAAYRADAYTEEGLLNHLFVENTAWTVSGLAAGTCGGILAAWAVNRTMDALNAKVTVAGAKEFVAQVAIYKKNVVEFANEAMSNMTLASLKIPSTYGTNCVDAVNTLFAKAFPELSMMNGFSTKFGMLTASKNVSANLSAADYEVLNTIKTQYTEVKGSIDKTFEGWRETGIKIAESNGVSKLAMFGTGMLYVVSAALMLYSAYSLGTTVWNYYNPDFSDIPVAIVDLIETPDGDRYIKYDAALCAETNDNGVYLPADLNAFEGQRWNALYYTKSYEAGKPLLADTFVTSASNNKPRDGYSPVHRFGEVVCYNLNKYTYGLTDSIYLSVKQSKNDKSAVADVPPVVGSMIGTGFILLAGGVGAVVGAGGTLGTLELIKRKKNKVTDK